jgi:hypothetical protein
MPATPVTQNHIKGLVESFDAPAIYKRRKVGESDVTQVPRHTATPPQQRSRQSGAPPALPHAALRLAVFLAAAAAPAALPASHTQRAPPTHPCE